MSPIGVMPKMGSFGEAPARGQRADQLAVHVHRRAAHALRHARVDDPRRGGARQDHVALGASARDHAHDLGFEGLDGVADEHRAHEGRLARVQARGGQRRDVGSGEEQGGEGEERERCGRGCLHGGGLYQRRHASHDRAA